MWAGRGEAASSLPNIPGSLDAMTIRPFEPSQFPPDVQKAYRKKWDKLFKEILNKGARFLVIPPTLEGSLSLSFSLSGLNQRFLKK